MNSNRQKLRNCLLPPMESGIGSRSFVDQSRSGAQHRRPLRLMPLDSGMQMKQELVSRLYGQGVPNIPLPSIRRNFDLPSTESKPLSVKLRNRRGESLSPLRKRLQEMNVTVLEKAYEEEDSGIGDLSVSDIQPRRNSDMIRVQYRNMRHQKESLYSIGKPSITGLSIMSSLKPIARGAVDRSKYSANLNKSFIESGREKASRVLNEPSLAVELSPQEHLEKIWSRKLIENLRNRKRQNEEDTYRTADPRPNISMEISQAPAGHESPELPSPSQAPVAAQEEEQEWPDLDKYLEALLEDSEQATTKFMYFNVKKNSSNPYDLEISNYSERHHRQFYTISGKGVTSYKNDKAVDFNPLSEWLIERDLFSHIKEITFFKHFRRWKLINVWRKGIVYQRRKKIIDDLGEHLFYLDDIYRNQILQHRAYMCEISKLRLMDMNNQGEASNIEEFANRQRKKRNVMTEKIKEFSGKCRENFRTVMKRSLNKLRNQILLEKSLDEEKGVVQPTNKKKLAGNQVFEALGFPDNLTYGHRAALRRECMRFLRLAYLVDFITVKALGDIYLDTVREAVQLLERLDINAKEEINASHDILRKLATTEPVLQISVIFNPKIEIPNNEIQLKEIKEFSEKNSEPQDFDLLCHIEVVENPEEYALSRLNKPMLTKIVPNIVRIWIDLNPGKEEFVDLLMDCFSEALQVVQGFERWSRHDELTPFATALEEWDEIVGGNWDEPDSPYLDPRSYICEQEAFQKQETTVRSLVENAYSKAFNYLAKFKDFLYAYWVNQNADFSQLLHKNVMKPSETMTNTLRLLEFQKKEFIENIPESCNYGIVKINSSQARKDLLPSPVVTIKKIEELAGVVLRTRVQEIKQWIANSRNELQIKINSVEDFVSQKKSCEVITDQYQSMKDSVDIYGNLYSILGDFGLHVKKDDKQYHSETLQEVMQLYQIIMGVSDQQELDMDKFKRNLHEELIPSLIQNLELLKTHIEDEKLLTKEEGMEDNLQKIEKLEIRFKEAEELSEKYKSYQQTLDMEQSDFSMVEEVRENLLLRKDLWNSLKDWSILTERWSSQQFATINSKEIGTKAEYYSKIAYRVDRELPENPISSELKVMVDTFKKAVPIVLALRNENLKAHHWNSIKDLLKSNFNIYDPNFTLRSLLSIHVIDFQEEIQQISIQASQEASLKAQLQKIDEKWKEVSFSVQPYTKDNYVLDEIDDLLNVLDESLADINTILGSRYIKPLLPEAEKWRNTFLNLQVIMDEWSMCQHKWIYLEHIFSSPDTKKMLPTESSKFDSVDKFYRGIMQKAYKMGNPLRLLRNYKGDILDNFRHYNKTLDDIEKMLEDHLETKRKDFPRFYFLSNDELLEILANQQDFEVIQQSLRKCFDNLYKLEFINDNNDIAAMFSSEGERMQFFRPTKVKDNIEDWLKNVQENMKDTIYRGLRFGFSDYDNLDRNDWVIKHPGQVVATIAQIMWCMITEDAILEAGSTNPNSLIDWYEDNVGQIQQLTELVRGKLDPIKRKVVVALMTTDVHARDILESLVLANVNKVNDFNWQKQLRFYWEEDDCLPLPQYTSCYVRQVNAKLEYGYEYIGPSSRLVITPLTDRCWMTITGALHIHLGAAPAGPAGTGKTESTKDLAKGLGMFCIVFNCSEQIHYKMMARLFSGVVQQGAWTCLDEFNRINIEVLSVVARQVKDIRNALLRGDEMFTFEEKEIPLKTTCGIFVTMNPGYAGRTELPDNLKVHFRPVAMMIPDYELIAEIMLFAEGFGRAKALSKKMVKLYKLASEQLSQQSHYDFGMRAVKSVLVMAGSLKRAEPGLNEEAVLLRAMRDSNIPKFVKDDLPLFHALIRDLFPTLEVTPVDYGPLLKQIHESITHMGLQIVPSFVEKVLQLFEICCIRFGVMIVGQTGGGKTQCFQVLKEAMIELHKQALDDDRYQNVTLDILNPKAIDLGELYGEVNSSTQEWRDGLASKLIRKAAGETGTDKNWIVFDGPVDSLWIENMNTVLDDTMTLCLSNGQRVKLRSEMKMLFEVQDLAVASPATVSRCGMVYLPNDTVGWRPYVQSWIQTNYSDNIILDQELQDQLLYFFDLSVDRGINKIRSALVEPIKTTDLQLASSICNFCDVFITQETLRGDRNDKKKILGLIYAYSYIWGLGGSLDELSKEKMDFFIRNIFESIDIPSTQTVYDYFMDPTKGMSFRSWIDQVPEYTYDKEVPYFQIMVPTIETMRQGYCLQKLLSKHKSIFFTGVTGIGKSIIIQHTLNSLQATKGIVPVQIAFSAQTSSKRTQMSIEDKLQKKRRDCYGAQVGQQIAVFIDDVNMPSVEVYGAQPPIELLRLLIDKRGLYDREKLFWKYIEDTTLICAAGPPGGGRREITPRFTSKFNMVCISKPNKGLMQQIFESIISGYMKDSNFGESVQNLLQDMVGCTINLYEVICEELRPTPSKFHYTFNLRDVSKVFQGMMMARPQSVGSPDVFIRLWVNEVSRVYTDRLINQEDKEWISKLITIYSSKHLKTAWEYEDMFVKNKLLWGDILKIDAPIRYYEEIKDLTKLRKILDNQLEDYNIKTIKKMHLVFFDDAIDHIIRICRVLRQPKGYIMLIGVGGSGKSVLTRLSAFMQKYEMRELEIKKDASMDVFKTFMKELLLGAGVEGLPLCFLLSDTQIVSEVLLEDVNSLLNNGEIPNLFAPEEVEKIINDLRPVVSEQKRDESRTGILNFFVERVRLNLHITLSMSPVGDALRQRCRKFPSLINCCTLNWFSRWPDSALLSVSNRFLGEIEDITPAIKKILAQSCMEIHIEVEEKSLELYSELKRKIYITPKSYLDLIKLYVEGLKAKRKQFGDRRDRYTGGIEKLKLTNKQISEMKLRLEEMQPKLKEKSEYLDVAQKKANEEQRNVAEKEHFVAAQSQEVNEKAKVAKAIADDAEADLMVMKPELDAAMSEVRQLDRKSIIEIKTFTNPHPIVVMIMEAVMLLLGEKTDFNNARHQLADTGEFVQRLINYGDKIGTVPESTIRKLRSTYLSNPDFDPDKASSISSATKTLVKWVKAMNNYYDVMIKVEPKKKKYAEEKANLDQANAALESKMKELNAIKQHAAKLKVECERLLGDRNKLAEEMSITRRRLTRAEELMTLLSDEDERWNSSAKLIQVEIEKLVGNVFLSAACISYLGPFTGPYREAMSKHWASNIIEKNVPVSDNFGLISTMGEQILIRDWQDFGLPTDTVSTENAIIATEAQRFPLMIDPQIQANRWIKNLYKRKGLIIMKLTNADFMRSLCNAIRIGKPVLIEDVEEALDASIDPLLEKQIYQNEAGIRFIRLDNKDVEYDINFRLFITTKLPNPHYMPEICIKVTLINFTVTYSGLEDQLLADVVKQENPEIEEKRDEIIKQLAADKKELTWAEDNILRLLASSTLEQILDEEAVIDTLKNAKNTSQEIGHRLKESEKLETKINQTRESYRSVASQGSTLYFVIADLINIDFMYQYSLDYVKEIFNLAIEKSPKAKDQDERLQILIDNITKMLFSNISRGLFEAHKTVFSFLICVSLKRRDKMISETEWNYFTRDVGVFKGESPPNPLPKRISKQSWILAQALDRDLGDKFGGLLKDIVEDKTAWEQYAQHTDPHMQPLPSKWERALSNFEKLLILKIFRPEKMLQASIEYVNKEMGKYYIENSAGSLSDVFNDSKSTTPIIFILSQGADPTITLENFAETKEFKERMTTLSLGQGQGPTARRIIEVGQQKGEWVLLQNCHLAKSWMKELEIIVESFKENKAIHEEFRLFLTSMPVDYFPPGVLQNGVKLTTEPPRGIKANLKRSYQGMVSTRFDTCTKKTEAWKKLLFGLCFFHSVLQERRKFGPLGFNIRYEFNDSDLETSMTMLKMFLEEQEAIPWEALNFVTGHINYGGRVTDDWDRRCLLCILGKYYTPGILTEGYDFSLSGTYFAPLFETLDQYIEYINSLPLEDLPEVFGMHENANITYEQNESDKLFKAILQMEPKVVVSASGKSPDVIVTEFIVDLQARAPIIMDQTAGRKDLFVTLGNTGLVSSLTTVLLQEMERFNNLITVIHSSLEQLQSAIKGEIVMSQELDSMYVSLLNSSVPDLWKNAAYPSLKPLFAWYIDLIKRVEFMRNWLMNGQPKSFWLPGFFFPQGFMTGTLQNFARKHKVAIDRLSFGYKAVPGTVSSIKAAPDDGIYVYGLYLEGGRWDAKNCLLADQFPGSVYGEVPILWFIPTANYVAPPNTYACPTYKTSVRAGVLSTTGQSTNYIVCIDLPTDKSSDYWTLNGTAILCQLND